MSRRFAFSNRILDAMIARSPIGGFTRDVPDAALVDAFPARDDHGLLVTPASESDAGRGKPYADAYHAGLPVKGCPGIVAPWLASYKITSEDRNPRNAVLTTGTGPLGGGVKGHNRHIRGILDGLLNGTATIPVICLNYIKDQDQWFKLEINPARVIADHGVQEATGKRGVPAVFTTKRVKSGGRYLAYTSLRVNFAPCVKLGYTDGWQPIDAPTLPTEVTL